MIRFLFAFIFVIFLWLAFASNWQTPVDATMSEDGQMKYIYEKESSDVLETVSSYVVMDAETGEVLLSKDPDKILPLASVTKLLVAGAIVDSPWLSDSVSIIKEDLKAVGESGSLKVGDTYTYRELLFPYLLSSSNDVGSVLERTKSDEIKRAIYDTLDEADVKDEIQIVDATGLSSKNVGSAKTVAFLFKHLMKKAPHVLDITEIPRYVGQNGSYKNNIPVQPLAGYKGGKHGYTDEAGRTLVASFSTAFIDGERDLIYVVMNTDDLLLATETLQSIIKESVKRVPITSDIISAP